LERISIISIFLGLSLSSFSHGGISAQRLMWLYFFGRIKTSKPAEKITPMQQ
jgi:uncharacterized membrane protein